ncbi:hypothetical protein KDW40_02010 [Burkholderia cenocepacia]|uniref:hypothetical protein n=1 Tax=Burkholderia cenocepacia TaxID=95486 RepID=UPI001BA020A4|nr:hypothetical protein [Burkholderia cenocepacia]MBR8043125.1 hypothetical protein [Burkholderia cenocepacia]MBR8324505.1 hypothetical protein [Burkholderia cenocepacia]
MSNIDGAVSANEDNQAANAASAAARVREAGIALKRDLIGSVQNRTAVEAAVALAIDAVFGAWSRLGIDGDAAKFVDHIESAWQLETLETQLKEQRATSISGEYELYRDWLTPFRRPANPADPMGGQIETLKIEASFGEYLENLRKIARGTLAKANTSATVKPVAAAAASNVEDSGKRKWFDKTTARGRKERWILTAILVAFAAVWTHNHWNHQQPAASAADAAQSDDSSN